MFLVLDWNELETEANAGSFKNATRPTLFQPQILLVLQLYIIYIFCGLVPFMESVLFASSPFGLYLLIYVLIPVYIILYIYILCPMKFV